MIQPESVQRFQGIIARRYAEPAPFPDPGDPPSVDPVACPYDAFTINSDSSLYLTRETPRRRISVGARVIPAEVGDPCDIVVINGVAFLHVHEGIPFKEACEGG